MQKTLHPLTFTNTHLLNNYRDQIVDVSRARWSTMSFNIFSVITAVKKRNANFYGHYREALDHYRGNQ